MIGKVRLLTSKMFFSVKKEISHRIDNVDPYTVTKSKTKKKTKMHLIWSWS